MRFLVAILMVGTEAGAAEPVTSAWIMSRPAANAEMRRIQPEVHEVIVEKGTVEVRSAGISLLYLGPFQNPLTGDGGVRDLRFRLPRNPVPAEGEPQSVGPGVVGVFLNGVPLYNLFAESSYLGRNMWHFDPVAFTQSNLGVLQQMIANGSSHSPILGFALDGFPIYGPWAFARADGSGGLRRMSSGYHLRDIGERTRWADGTELTPSQYGPPIETTFPAGTFAEDYEYKPDEGELDASNGRFCVTPEYPNGTYAYFLTSDGTGKLAFPYFLTDRFRGKLAVEGELSTSTAHFIHGDLKTGRPVEFRFAFPGVRSLEIVHEKPIHLMVVSSDLTLFDHIHPRWTLGNQYAVTHNFPKPGKYRLFAQFTPPGEVERIETYDVVVTGTASIPQLLKQPPLIAKLHRPDRVSINRDVTFTVELSGAPIEPYLGAWGHFVFLDEHLGNFIHAHPSESASAAPDPRRPHIHGVSDAPSGPPPTSISITTNFSQAGAYKLWAQFQVAGEPVVIPFLLNVEGAAALLHAPKEIPAGAFPLTVDSGGFHPARIQATPGKPVTLAVTRASTPNCGGKIAFPSLGIQRDLPIGQTTLIELPAFQGDIEFACGMGMFRGLIVGVTQRPY